MNTLHQLSTAIPRTSAKSHTLLLVDDELDILELTASYLRSMGYETLTAPDALAALRLLNEHPEIGLLITDILMPGDLNGIELAERFLELRPGAPVIYTSGYPAGSLTWNRNMLSSSNMLVKPFRFSELHMLIERLLRTPLRFPVNPHLAVNATFHSR